MVFVFTFLAFMLAMALILSGYYMVTAETVLEQRLRTYAPSAAGATARTRGQGPSPIARLLIAIGRVGSTGNERSLRKTLAHAGYRSQNAALVFVGLRTIISVAPALAFLVPAISRGEPLAKTVYLALLIWGLGHMLANFLLRSRANGRILSIATALPDSLDLMVVCLEAGLGLTATIARVGEERSAMNDPLGVEFSRVARELREGRSREDSLRDLGDRNGVEDLKALVGLIIQADKLGASMAKTLRAHAEVLRTKRRQRAEEAARKLPIKVLFPLALCILPALFVVTIGPSILRIGDLVATVSSKK
jgi:tight adherence protein C